MPFGNSPFRLQPAAGVVRVIPLGGAENTRFRPSPGGSRLSSLLGGRISPAGEPSARVYPRRNRAASRDHPYDPLALAVDPLSRHSEPGSPQPWGRCWAASRSQVADSTRLTAREDSGDQASSRSWPASGLHCPRSAGPPTGTPARWGASAVRRPEPASRAQHHPHGSLESRQFSERHCG